MLKTLLLSGWFRVQPFLKYVLVVMAIAPVMAASSHATSANLSSVATKSDEGITATVSESNKTSDEAVIVANTTNLSANSNPVASRTQASNQNAFQEEMIAVVEPGLLHAYVGGISTGNYFPQEESQQGDPLPSVELAPSSEGNASSKHLNNSQADLIAKLKSAREYGDSTQLSGNGQTYFTAKVQPAIRDHQPILDDAPVVETRPQQQDNQDPLGSAYPVPMKWIMATQEEVGPRGGGTRYYRSHPVVSPDGRYAVYSRIQLEVKPQMHNTRVSSVLFIEDRQTKRLQVVTSTSRNNDALLPVRVVGDANGDGTIGVLVPISWSQKGDRFLARRFEGIMNTSDASDYAVIWNRHEGDTRTVSPIDRQAKQDVEKISILLGWSKSQPDRVLFRTGEMGDENWPVISVSDDGSAIRASELDQPVTFREVSQVWAEPQFVYR